MKAKVVGKISDLRRLGAFVAAAIVILSIVLSVAQPAVAAAYQYCCVDVQAGAAARTSAGNATTGQLGTFAGWVTPDQFLGKTKTTQRSYVSCYRDGAWATGNYRSNRWFYVYVHLSNGRLGYYFVHSSYVYNQTSVPRC